MENGYEHALFMQKASPGKMEEYIEVHKKVWPELLKEIKESGIEREFIWVHGDFIYVYMMSKNFEKAMAKLGEKEIFKKWIEKMDTIMDEMQDYSGGGNIVTLENVFDLEKQLSEL